MSIIYRGLLAATIGVTTPSCAQGVRSEASDICSNASPHHVCEAPFEVVFSNRATLMGRNVRLEGFLVIGVRPEPLSPREPVVLLFSSVERAQICNPSFAVELLSTSKDVTEWLELAKGGFVSVAGKLAPSPRGHWAQMEVIKASPMLGKQQHGIERLCMQPPPPPLPEPKSKQELP